MSLKDTSIEERLIISSLAAINSFSAVVFLAARGRGGMLVFKSDAMTCPAGKSGVQITRSGPPTQELIDRLTKSFAPLKPAPLIPNTTHNHQGEQSWPRPISSPPHAPRAAAREAASPAGIRRTSPLPCWIR